MSQKLLQKLPPSSKRISMHNNISSFLEYGQNLNLTVQNLLLLSLAPQPSLGFGLLHKIRLNFLEASQQFSFYRVELLAPRPTPIPEA
jgi:hypothetical protein